MRKDYLPCVLRSIERSSPRKDSDADDGETPNIPRRHRNPGRIVIRFAYLQNHRPVAGSHAFAWGKRPTSAMPAVGECASQCELDDPSPPGERGA